MVADESVLEKNGQFAARKTCNYMGDIRKAFHMCKVAAEAVLEDCSSGKRQVSESSRPTVKISDVQKGSRDVLSLALLQAISCASVYEALVLISIGALKKGREDGLLEPKDILTKVESIANASGDPRYSVPLSFTNLLMILNRLGDVSA